MFEDLLDGQELTNLREASGRVDVSIMNIVGFDASTFGNHEFDLGTATIAEIIGTDIRGDTLGDVRWLGGQFPYLGANLDFGGDGNLSGLFTGNILPSTAFQSLPDDLAAAAAAPKIAPSTVIEVNGERIGVVGATTPLLETISSPGDHLRQGSGRRDQRHGGPRRHPAAGNRRPDRRGDRQNCPDHPPAAARARAGTRPAAVGRGYLHRRRFGHDPRQSDDALRPGDVAAGPYPVVTTDFNGNPAVIVSTDGEYSYVGRLVVTFDADGILVDAEGNPIDDTGGSRSHSERPDRHH